MSNTQQPRITLIAAISANRGLGKDNQLLWHISEDLKFFKKTTSGNPVIMGRNTFESIGRPLPNRLNIIVSRVWSDAGKKVEGCVVSPSVEQAISAAHEHIAQRDISEIEPEIFIIGGAQLYQYTLAQKLAQRIVLTEIDKTADADAFFPELDNQHWHEVWREAHFDEKNALNFAFVDYRLTQPHESHE